MGHVFLSYARPRAAAAKRAADGLTAAGFDVWWDDQLPAHRAFHEVIDERLHAAEAVLVLWSADAAKSDWVRAEADFARTHGKLVQASLDGSLPPMPFNQIQCVTLTGWKGDTDHPDWVKLLNGLRAAAKREPRPAEGVRAPRGARWRLAGWIVASLVIVVVGGGIYSTFKGNESTPSSPGTASLLATPRIAVLPFEPISASPQAAEFAAALADKVAGSLSENLMQTLAMPRAGEFVGSDRLSKLKARGVNLALGGSVRASDDRLFVRAYFEDLDSEFTVWSAQFERSVDEQALLLIEVAAAATEVAYAVAEALAQPDSGLDAQGLSSHLKLDEALKHFGRVTPQRMLVMAEEMVLRAPKFAAAHGYLALLLAEYPLDGVPARLARARREAETAIALYPATGAAYEALFFLARVEAPTDLVLAERELLRGLAGAPNFTFLQMRRCEFLMGVGRIREAVEFCQRAAALRPLAPPSAFRLVQALWAAGDNEGAMKTLEHAAANHPNSFWVNIFRFDMLAASGRTHEAAAMLTNASTRPTDLSQENVPVVQAYLVARGTQTSADVNLATEKLLTATSAGTFDLVVAARLAAQLGKTGEALGLLARVDPGALGYGSYIFGPSLRSVSRDPRFMKLAARTGHIAYWRKTGVWPDYCADPTLPYRCEAEADKALPVRRA